MGSLMKETNNLINRKKIGGGGGKRVKRVARDVAEGGKKIVDFRKEKSAGFCIQPR